MSKGEVHPGEAQTFRDSQSGAVIRQVTDHPSVHHHPFFFMPAYDDAMRRLIFVSHRTGAPQIFVEDRGSGNLVQLTDRPDLDEWSVHPARNGRHVLFTAGGAGWRLDTETLEETCLLEFGPDAVRREGMVAAEMGTTGLSWDGRWWAVPVKLAEGFRLHVIDVEQGGGGAILERDIVGHPQFCPDDPDLIHYIGPHGDRVWVIHRDGSGNRRIYARNAARNEWIVHESWIPGTREIAFADWPHGVRAIQVDSGTDRQVCRFNAWHPVASPDGRRMVADTNFPDIGLQIFDPLDGIGTPTTLCFAGASQAGAHWGGPFPYAKGPIKVYAPQHTHPHPVFAPDSSRVVFTSDRTGHAQVYECLLREK